jgi:hypothetical protein
MQDSPAMQVPVAASGLVAPASGLGAPASAPPDPPSSGEGTNGKLCLHPAPAAASATVTPTATRQENTVQPDTHPVIDGVLHSRFWASTNQNVILHPTQGPWPIVIPGLHASADLSASGCADAGSVNHKTNPVAANTPAPTNPPSSRL